jgi:hypothetical protein
MRWTRWCRAGRRRSGAEHDLRLGIGGAERHAERAQEDVELGGVAAGDPELVVGRAREVEHLGDGLEAVGGDGELVGVGARGKGDAHEGLEPAAAGRGVDEGSEAGDDARAP